MPNLGAFHPQIVHFVIGLLLVGVAMRIVSLTGRLKFTSPMATTLLLIGTVAAWAAVKSGTDAHGPVERIPGARAAVVEHEEHGETTRNVFLVVAALELIGLAMTRKDTLARNVRWVYASSARSTSTRPASTVVSSSTPTPVGRAFAPASRRTPSACFLRVSTIRRWQTARRAGTPRRTS